MHAGGRRWVASGGARDPNKSSQSVCGLGGVWGEKGRSPEGGGPGLKKLHGLVHDFSCFSLNFRSSKTNTKENHEHVT